MGKILVVGEALVDLVERPDGSSGVHVGGSPLNVSVGLVHLGGEVVFGTTLGGDSYGALIRSHLDGNGVVVQEMGSGAVRPALPRQLSTQPVTPSMTHASTAIRRVAPFIDHNPVMTFAASGLFSVLATPFHENGEVDFDSLDRLVAFNIEAGASGLLALGVAGEASHLSEDERRLVSERVLDASQGRPIVAGVSDPDTVVAMRRASEIAALGLSAVMVAVPPDVSRLVDHIAGVASAAGPLSVIVQDYPRNGTPLVSVEELAELAEVVPSVIAVKAEAPPTSSKIRDLRRLAPQISQFGGLSGLYSFWELKAGAAGMMTGFAFPEKLVQIIRYAAAGDWAEARRLYDEALPAMVWESQPGAEIGLRKLVLQARGVIDSATTRAPMPDLHACEDDARELIRT